MPGPWAPSRANSSLMIVQNQRKGTCHSTQDRFRLGASCLQTPHHVPDLSQQQTPLARLIYKAESVRSSRHPVLCLLILKRDRESERERRRETETEGQTERRQGSAKERPEKDVLPYRPTLAFSDLPSPGSVPQSRLLLAVHLPVSASDSTP